MTCKDTCCCDCKQQADGTNELCKLGKLGCGNAKETCGESGERDDTCTGFERKAVSK